MSVGRGTGTMLYVHVPFCLSKCAYCDFASVAGSCSADHERYLATAREHVLHWRSRRVFDAGVPSVYIGGGTPTLLGDALVELVAWITREVPLAADAEVTVETNPETTDASLVAALVAAGVNRFSLGVQSFDADALRLLGRCHDAATAEKAARVLRDSGARFSVDLICGVPGLNEAAWRDTLERAIATGAGHVSVYPLAVEDGTPLQARIDDGAVPDTDPDRAATDMLVAARVLGEHGLVRYEIANYARPGEESRHNLGYWTGVPYVGIGPSAAGMLPTAEGRRRFVYPSDLRTWFAVDPAEPHDESLDAEQTAREDAMLRLRLSAGLDECRATDAGISPVLEKLADDGLVERESGHWRTTERGWLLGNEVFERVLFD